MHMETFVKIIIKRLKDANLFASQGGPIILAQVRQSKLLQQPTLEISFFEKNVKMTLERLTP